MRLGRAPVEHLEALRRVLDEAGRDECGARPAGSCRRSASPIGGRARSNSATCSPSSGRHRPRPSVLHRRQRALCEDERLAARTSFSDRRAAGAPRSTTSRIVARHGHARRCWKPAWLEVTRLGHNLGKIHDAPTATKLRAEVVRCVSHAARVSLRRPRAQRAPRRFRRGVPLVFRKEGLGKDVTDKFLGRPAGGIQKEGCDGLITSARWIVHRMPASTRSRTVLAWSSSATRRTRCPRSSRSADHYMFGCWRHPHGAWSSSATRRTRCRRSSTSRISCSPRPGARRCSPGSSTSTIAT